MENKDVYFMNKAINLARLARGNTKTNPLVGAVIVKNNTIIGEGYHKYFGGEHAEEDAINNAVESVYGSTLYVTLEPCSHIGKRNACCDLIIKNKIKKVVIGSRDINPKVNGIEKLKKAGIEVVTGVLEKECNDLNRVFFHSIKNKMPYVVLKSAMSLDGKIATKTSDSKWITSSESRKSGRMLRGYLDGILVGINTILKDDPSLNTRIDNLRDPVRIIVDSKLRIPIDSKVLNIKSSAKTIIFTTKYYDLEKYNLLKDKENVEVIIVNEKDNKVDLSEILKVLYEKDISSILLEGGGNLNYSMLKENLVNRVYFYIAPMIIGGKDAKTSVEGDGIERIKDGFNINITSIEKIDRDILVIGDVENVYRNS